MSRQNRKRKLIKLDIKKKIISKLFTRVRLFTFFKFTCKVHIKAK